MRAGTSFWGQSITQYLAGNGKIYDGSFDADIINSTLNSEYNVPFSMLCTLKITGNANLGFGYMLNNLRTAPGGSGLVGFGFAVENPSSGIHRLFLTLRADTNGSNLFSVRKNSTIDLPLNTSIVLCATYSGSGTASGVKLYVNGYEDAGTVVSDNLEARSILSNVNARIGQAANSANTRLNGIIRQLEVLNRVATPTEVANASYTGSFRGAGIAHNSGQYLLAVDFDKTGTSNLTTFASTPTYTIAAQGGAAYTTYQ